MPSWPHFDEEQVAAAAAVLRSGRVNYWTGGEGRAFEREYAGHLGLPHAVALANGTVALELGLRALGVGPGHDVVVPSRTFVATAAAVLTVGARPVFADVDETTGGLTVATVEAVATPRTRAVVPVHLGGWPVDVPALLAWARAHRSGAGPVAVLEDCAQAHGAVLHGRPVGSLGDAAAFSFCQDKVLTTAGEGGLLATRDDGVADRVWAAKDHGKSRAALARDDHGPGFRWVHDSVGTNARMTEVQAAVGRVALRRLPAWVATRRHHAATLTGLLGTHPALRVPAPPAGVEPSWYRWYAFVRPEALAPGWDRDRVLAELLDRGVPASVGSCPEVYRERAMSGVWDSCARHPVARRLGETGLALPVHPTLADADVARCAEVVADVLAVASA